MYHGWLMIELISKLKITSLNLEFLIINQNCDKRNSFETLIDMRIKLVFG
jgi:hypothetical protein